VSRTRCRYFFPRPVADTFEINTGNPNVQRALGYYQKPYRLQRTPDEVYINDYNPTLLTLWNGNMDIQFTSDARDSGQNIRDYVTSYATKSENKASKELIGMFH